MKALEIEEIDDFTAERLELDDIKAEQVLEITTRETTYVLGIIRVKGSNIAVVVLKAPQNGLLSEGERVCLVLVDRDGSDTSKGQRLMFFTKDGTFKFNSSKVKGFVMREPGWIERISFEGLPEVYSPSLAMFLRETSPSPFSAKQAILILLFIVGVIALSRWVS